MNWLVQCFPRLAARDEAEVWTRTQQGNKNINAHGDVGLSAISDLHVAWCMVNAQGYIFVGGNDCATH